MGDPNRDVRCLFPGRLEEMEAYDQNGDIDAYAEVLRGTMIYACWRLRRALKILCLTAFPFLQRFFPGVSLDKDWRD